MSKDTVRKIVALNSGGFDSVVMLHMIKEIHPFLEVTTLFFDYGQKSVELERAKAKEVSSKLGYTFKELKLPPFDWTTSDFYNEGFKSSKDEYLEFRNLVFVSYGLSFSSGIGADTLFLATLKSYGYFDTSPEFFKYLRGIAQSESVSIETPLSLTVKEDMGELIKHFNIKEDEFHTCDNPVDGKACGECPDCLALSYLFRKPLRLVKSNPIDEVE